MKSKKEAEKMPLLPTAKAVPVADTSVWQQPESQTMSRAVMAETATIEDFMEEATDGLMIRERAYISQILCGVCEKQTQFKVANFDPAVVPENPEDVHFTSRPASFQVRERSECIQRYCCHQLRHLELGVFPVGGTMISMGEASGWPDGVDPILIMEKPFKCPVVCCCFMPFPFEMRVNRPATSKAPGQYFGRTVCDWKW